MTLDDASVSGGGVTWRMTVGTVRMRRRARTPRAARASLGAAWVSVFREGGSVMDKGIAVTPPMKQVRLASFVR